MTIESHMVLRGDLEKESGSLTVLGSFKHLWGLVKIEKKRKKNYAFEFRKTCRAKEPHSGS